MTDPYRILGVSRTAGDDEIKKAYRALVKKYHPDNYQDSPLADLAEQKMAEINNAYDEIVKQRKAAENGGSYYGQNPYQSTYGGYGQNDSYGGYYSYGGESGQFEDIRRLINMGRVLEAQELLDGINPASRDAEWYFLKGYVFYVRGFLEDAYPYLKRAVEMDPSNMEYRDMFSRIEAGRQNGYMGSDSYSSHSCCPFGICPCACLPCLTCYPGWFCCI